MVTFKEWKEAKRLEAHAKDVERRERIDDIRAQVKKLHKELKCLKQEKIAKPNMSAEAYAAYELSVYGIKTEGQ